jgi:Tfp pilus assembly protein PilN
MIGTEIVVLLAFVSRFSLDRRLTDLKEEISQKQAILEANSDFEREFRGLQEKLANVKKLSTDQAKPFEVLTLFQSLLPPDVYLESFELANNKIKTGAVAGTTEGFSRFLANVQSSKQISNIDIGSIKKTALKGIQFEFTALIGGAKPR